MTTNSRQLILILVVLITGIALQLTFFWESGADFFTVVFKTNPWLWFIYFFGVSIVVEKITNKHRRDE